jgi:hypothetical protein
MDVMVTIPSGPTSRVSAAMISGCRFLSVQFQRFFMWLSVLEAQQARHGQLRVSSMLCRTCKADGAA